VSIIATTGHREPSRWPPGVRDAWTTLVDSPDVTVLRFGLAKGWDTTALRIAGAVRARRPKTWPPLVFEGYATAMVVDLPSDAHEAVNRWFGDGDLLVERRARWAAVRVLGRRPERDGQHRRGGSGARGAGRGAGAAGAGGPEEGGVMEALVIAVLVCAYTAAVWLVGALSMLLAVLVAGVWTWGWPEEWPS
jgi:hypothetical protein